jgi:choline dehydrogenase-like flavoprotein
MSKDYPVPPMPLKASGALFKIGAAKLGWSVVHGPIAIISKSYMGRSACVNCGMCSGFGCHVKARSSSAVTMLPIAERTGNCEIRVRSYVREISTDSSGKCTGVVYFDKDKKEIFQKAEERRPVGERIGDAAAPAHLEVGQVPRRSRQFKRRRRQYLMLGNGAGASALFEHPLNDYKGVVTGAASSTSSNGSEARLLRRRTA